MEAVIILGVNILTTIIRKFIFPRWGKTGVQAIVAVLSLIGALYYTYGDSFPQLKVLVAVATGIFVLAISIYEVILSRLPAFQSEEKKAALAKKG